MKALGKDFRMEIKKSMARFISIFLIVALGVAFFSGVQATSPDMRYSGDVYFDDAKLMDLRIQGTKGLTGDDLAAVQALSGVEIAEGSYGIDVLCDEGDVQGVLHVEAMSDKMNFLEVREGRLPSQPGEAFLDYYYAQSQGFSCGDTLVLREGGDDNLLKVKTYTITGTGNSPLYISFNRGNTTLGSGEVGGFVYITPDNFDSEVYTQIRLRIHGSDSLTSYTDAYDDMVDRIHDEVEEISDERCRIRYDEILAEADEKLADARKELEDGKKEAEEKLSDAEKELSDAEKKISDGKKEIEDGEKKLSDAKKELEDGRRQIQDGYAELDSARTELSEGRSQAEEGQAALDDAKAEFEAGEKEFSAKEQEAADARAAFDEGYARLEEGESQIAEGYMLIEEQQAALDNGIAQAAAGRESIASLTEYLESQIGELEAGLAGLDVLIEGLESAPVPDEDAIAVLEAMREELSENYAEALAGQEQLYAQEAELDAAEESFPAAQAAIDQAREELASQEQAAAEAREQLEASEAPLLEGESQLEAAREELEAGRLELESQEQRLADAWAEIEAGEQQIAEGEATLAANEAALAAGEQEIRENEQKLADARKDLENGEKELADGKKKYEDAKKEADEKIADGEAKIRDAEEKIAEIAVPEWIITDRHDLPEYSDYGDSADRIRSIGEVFPVIFFLVAALISLTTMTRMVEEQRTLIGTYKALGYGKTAIAMKYLCYAFLATVLGSIFGILVGEKLFPYVIIKAYGILYRNMTATLEIRYELRFALTASAAAIVCTTGATLFACIRELRETPASLMRPPAPQEGRRVFLELIPVIWKRISFSQKSAIRNLFRYKKRLFMTVFGIAGSMGLMLVGFGIQDSIMDVAVLQYAELQLYDGTIIGDEDASEEEQRELDALLEAEDRLASYDRIALTKANAPYKKSNLSVYLYVPREPEKFDSDVTLRDRVTKKTFDLTDEGAVICEKTGRLLDIGPGDTIPVEIDHHRYEIPVAGVTENYMGHYIYLTPSLYRQVFGEEPEYLNTVFTAKPEYQDKVNAIGQKFLESPAALSVSYTDSLAAALDRMLSSLNLVIIVLIVSAGLLSFVVLYSLNNINITERKRELATLKVLGFFDTEVSGYVFRENIYLTVFGVIAGCAIGIFLHRFVITTVEVDAVMFGRTIKMLSYVWSAAITCAFSVFVNFVMHFKLKRIDMVESLKSVE